MGEIRRPVGDVAAALALLIALTCAPVGASASPSPPVGVTIRDFYIARAAPGYVAVLGLDRTHGPGPRHYSLRVVNGKYVTKHRAVLTWRPKRGLWMDAPPVTWGEGIGVRFNRGRDGKPVRLSVYRMFLDAKLQRLR